jgi:hypothetical protein
MKRYFSFSFFQKMGSLVGGFPSEITTPSWDRSLFFFFYGRGSQPKHPSVIVTDGVVVKNIVVYYESMKRKLKIKPMYECRCNGRLQTKRFTRLAHTGSVTANLFVYLQLNKKKAKAEGKKCHAKTMWSQ